MDKGHEVPDMNKHSICIRVSFVCNKAKNSSNIKSSLDPPGTMKDSSCLFY